jgi:hypothetical protein
LYLLIDFVAELVSIILKTIFPNLTAGNALERVGMRDKPWSIDEERHLRQLIEEGKGFSDISQVMGKSRVSVKDKLYNLGLSLKDNAHSRLTIAASSLPYKAPITNPAPALDRLYLRVLKIFHQPTTYAHVLRFIKLVQDRFGSFDKIRVDYTREGPSIIADMENSGIDNAEGVNFSVPRKSEMASLLKQRMSNNKFSIRY